MGMASPVFSIQQAFVLRAVREAQILERITGYALLEQRRSALSQVPVCERFLLVSARQVGGRQGWESSFFWELLDLSIPASAFLGLGVGCYVHFRLLRNQQ